MKISCLLQNFLLFFKVPLKFFVNVYKFSVHTPDICVCACVYNFFFGHVILLALFTHLIIDILHVKAHRTFFVNCLVICYMNTYLIGELPVFPSPFPLPCSLPLFLPPLFLFFFFCLYSPPVHVVVLSACTVLTGMCKENSFSLAVLSGTYSLPFPHPDCFNSHT